MHPTREEDYVSPNPTLRRWLVLALAGGSLAIGVPAALAAGGSDTASGSGSAPAAVDRFVQDEQPSTPDRGDCPEHDGSGSQGGSQDNSDAATPQL
jgi:hypothetical protein